MMSPESYFSNLNECTSSSCDPLEMLGDIMSEPKIYKMDRIIFAEPLNIKSIETGVPRENAEEIIHLDNVTVLKINGKRKKLCIKIHDNSNLTCPMQTCHKKFKSPILLKAHIRKIHYSEKKFQCEVCEASFTAQYLLRRHSAVHEK